MRTESMIIARISGVLTGKCGCHISPISDFLCILFLDSERSEIIVKQFYIFRDKFFCDTSEYVKISNIYVKSNCNTLEN